ncbi:hypothetical protein, partial [Campylobacter jejuni]|uniref:hypothetical protein n=1 Tax=Campylobacter jejuni TaxID=197 RepID=UPI001E3041D1
SRPGRGVMSKWLLWFVGDGSELHRQTYRAVREYQLAIKHTAILWWMVGLAMGAGLGLLR